MSSESSDESPFTFGRLLRALESGKRFRPNRSRMLGIDRLELYCNETFSGSGLTRENIRRVRADLCNRLHCRAEVVEDFCLDHVVDTLKGIQRVPLSFFTPEVMHRMAMAPLTWWDRLPELGLDVHPADCQIVEGSLPSVCPNADPPLPAEFLPSVVKTFKAMGQLPAGKTIHWIGYRAWQQNLCKCSLADATGADSDQEEAEQAEEVGAGIGQAEGEQAEGTDRRRRKGRGRPADTDPKTDKRIYDAWRTRQYKTYAALAQELHTTKRAVELAIGRHGKRLKRPKQNRCES